MTAMSCCSASTSEAPSIGIAYARIGHCTGPVQAPKLSHECRGGLWCHRFFERSGAEGIRAKRLVPGLGWQARHGVSALSVRSLDCSTTNA